MHTTPTFVERTFEHIQTVKSQNTLAVYNNAKFLEKTGDSVKVLNICKGIFSPQENLGRANITNHRRIFLVPVASYRGGGGGGERRLEYPPPPLDISFRDPQIPSGSS